MKKKILILCTISICAILLSSCKKNDSSDDSSTATPTTKGNAGALQTTTTFAPDATTAPVTEAPTVNAMQAWIDKLYDDLMAQNWDNVCKAAPTVAEVSTRCAEYHQKDWSMDFAPYEKAYLMTTSSGKHIGIVTYEFTTLEGYTKDEINVFSSENEKRNFGLESTAYNDTQLTYDIKKDNTYAIDFTLYNNVVKKRDGSKDFVLEENSGMSAWHA